MPENVDGLGPGDARSGRRDVHRAGLRVFRVGYAP